MSATPGHVTRKDGRINELPDRIHKILMWLTIAAYSVPVIMLLIGFGNSKGVLGPIWGTVVSLVPVGLIIGAMVGILRTGKVGNAVFAGGLVMMHYMALTVEPFTNGMLEMLVTRGTPIIGVAVLLYYLKVDLRYNLRPLWYSLSAMRDFQEMMMKAQAKKAAKKRGEVYDDSKVIDVEAQIKAYQQMTGKEIPAHMRGMNAKPGFRQESTAKKPASSGKSRKRK